MYELLFQAKIRTTSGIRLYWCIISNTKKLQTNCYVTLQPHKVSNEMKLKCTKISDIFVKNMSRKARVIIAEVV